MAKNSNYYRRVLEIPLYNTSCMLVIGGSFDDAIEEYIKCYHVDEVEADYLRGMSNLSGQANCFYYSLYAECCVWLGGVASTVHDVGTIAHECLHATNHILAVRGVEYHTINGNPNDEAYAYLLGYLTRELFKFSEDVCKLKKKKKLLRCM